MKIDIHSDTWEVVTAFITAEREKAVKQLISDLDSDKQRGRIALIDSILKLPNAPKDKPIELDNYN